MKRTEKAKHKKEKTIMYFKVQNPITLRREVLGTAIDTTKILREYEKFRSVKHLKLEKYKEFVNVFKEIESLSKKLRSKDLPTIDKVQRDIRKIKVSEKKLILGKEEVEKLQQKIEVEMHNEQPKEIKVQHHLSDEEKLDQELKDIQSKLNNLSM